MPDQIPPANFERVPNEPKQAITRGNYLLGSSVEETLKLVPQRLKENKWNLNYRVILLCDALHCNPNIGDIVRNLSAQPGIDIETAYCMGVYLTNKFGTELNWDSLLQGECIDPETNEPIFYIEQVHAEAALDTIDPETAEVSKDENIVISKDSTVVTINPIFVKPAKAELESIRERAMLYLENKNIDADRGVVAYTHLLMLSYLQKDLNLNGIIQIAPISIQDVDFVLTFVSGYNQSLEIVNNTVFRVSVEDTGQSVTNGYEYNIVVALPAFKNLVLNLIRILQSELQTYPLFLNQMKATLDSSKIYDLVYPVGAQKAPYMASMVQELDGNMQTEDDSPLHDEVLKPLLDDIMSRKIDITQLSDEEALTKLDITNDVWIENLLIDCLFSGYLKRINRKGENPKRMDEINSIANKLFDYMRSNGLFNKLLELSKKRPLVSAIREMVQSAYPFTSRILAASQNDSSILEQRFFNGDFVQARENEKEAKANRAAKKRKK